jgi:GH24 family phage-related lysozyme (muramidase)
MPIKHTHWTIHFQVQNAQGQYELTEAIEAEAAIPMTAIRLARRALPQHQQATAVVQQVFNCGRISRSQPTEQVAREVPVHSSWNQ